jgi:hypothetical protein
VGVDDAGSQPGLDVAGVDAETGENPGGSELAARDGSMHRFAAQAAPAGDILR